MTSSIQREEFWDRLDDCRSGMLDINGRAMPMAHNLAPEDGNIWFLTAKGTDMATAAETNEACRYILCNDAEGFYTQIEGRLSSVQDPRKFDEVWSDMAPLWFEEGKQDPDLVLVRMTPSEAEVWLAPKRGLHILWNAAKAKVTGETLEHGEHFKLVL